MCIKYYRNVLSESIRNKTLSLSLSHDPIPKRYTHISKSGHNIEVKKNKLR